MSRTDRLQFTQARKPYYGHEALAKLCARFVSQLFPGRDVQSAIKITSSKTIPPLDQFIAYACYRADLHCSVTFAALYILYCLKIQFPTARGVCGHNMFITAFMIASKFHCDASYSTKSWCIISWDIYTAREMNEMERDMCRFVDWRLNVRKDILQSFEDYVDNAFSKPGQYHPFCFQD